MSQILFRFLLFMLALCPLRAMAAETLVITLDESSGEKKLALAQPDVTHSTATVLTAANEAIAKLAGEKFSRGPQEEKLIALTFDDGPHPSRTPQVVEILKSHEATATFFMLGSMVEKNPGIARMVAEAGFEVGNHSISHARLNRGGEEKIRREIEEATHIIETATGQRPTLFRPPYGLVGSDMRAVCKEHGMAMIMWSVDPRDWESSATADSIISKVKQEAHNGAIICMHDIKGRTVEALPRLITELREEGYEFVTVSTMIERKAAEEVRLAAEGRSVDSAAAGSVNAPPDMTPLVIPLEDSE